MRLRLIPIILMSVLANFSLVQTQENQTSSLEKLKQELEQLKEEVKILKKDKESKKAPESDKNKAETEIEAPEINFKDDTTVPTATKSGKKPEMLIEEEFVEEEEQESKFYLKKTETSSSGLLQQATEKVAGSSLVLSGFFTLEFRDLQSEDSAFRFLPSLSPQSTFNNSHLNLYVDAKVLPDFRFFCELRFVYEPYSQFIESLGKISATSEVLIERAWVDWLFRDWLTVRAGNFLVPYGIWNLEHGDPILLSTFTPVMLRRDIFPERATGVQLYGHCSIQDVELLYYFWLGNGKGARLATEDEQNNKSIGARLETKLPDFQKLSGIAIGVSGYVGKGHGGTVSTTDDRIANSIYKVFAAKGQLSALRELNENGFDATGDPLGEFRDHALGVDLRFRFYNFFFQGEIVVNSVRPTEKVDSPVDTDGDGTADMVVTVTPKSFRQFGAYMQSAYEFDAGSWGLVTPFFRFDWLEGNDRFHRELAAFTIFISGVNWKINNNVALKAEYHVVRVRDAHERDLTGFYSSATVSF